VNITQEQVDRANPIRYGVATTTGIVYETCPRFVKPGEAQDKAIKRLMSTLARRKKAVTRSFPESKAYTATQAAYIAAFERLNHLISI
jgi:hypothetical protein